MTFWKVTFSVENGLVILGHYLLSLVLGSAFCLSTLARLVRVSARRLRPQFRRYIPEVYHYQYHYQRACASRSQTLRMHCCCIRLDTVHVEHGENTEGFSMTVIPRDWTTKPHPTGRIVFWWFFYIFAEQSSRHCFDNDAICRPEPTRAAILPLLTVHPFLNPPYGGRYHPSSVYKTLLIPPFFVQVLFSSSPLASISNPILRGDIHVATARERLLEQPHPSHADRIDS